MPAGPKIVLVYVARHGKTVLNADGCFRGNKDVPLNADGMRDAHKLATLFEGIPVSHILCSDRIRATKTAEIIAERKKREIHQSESLRALNVGDFSGKPRDAANTAALQHYIDAPDTTIPGGESLKTFKTRIRPCIYEAVTLAEEAGVPVLLVAHSSVIHEVGDMLYGDHHKILVDPGGVIAIYMQDGLLAAEPIYKKAAQQPNQRADTVS